MSEVRVRFAPSPTGYLHVGGLRTALFNYLFAKNQGGKLLLRFEDTDQTRKVEGAEENLLESLHWAGIEFDEGPHIGGSFGPYVQSQRLDIYKRHVDQLVAQGDAYPCFCTQAELDQMREEQVQKKLPPRYDGRCRRLKPEEREAKMAQGLPYTIRMKIIHSQGDYKVNDQIRGVVLFKPSQIDDQVILKTDGFPTYHLASVVDDHLMGITHVIRGEEWLPSTPKHLQLYEYFGWEAPQFSHLPLLLNPDRSKLSKRQGDVSTAEYRDKGFLPEALINFVALLGWNTGDTQEIYSMAELIQHFSIERVGKAGAVFDQQKLRWMNQHYIKQLPIEELMYALQPFMPDAAMRLEPAKLRQMVELVRDGLQQLNELEQQLDLFLNQNPHLEDEALKAIAKEPGSQAVYQSFIAEVEKEAELNTENFGAVMQRVQTATGAKGKGLWVPMRIAITLVQQGPDLTQVVGIFGKEKCLQMVRNQLV